MTNEERAEKLAALWTEVEKIYEGSSAAEEPILRFFNYEHLQGKLRAASQPFCLLAANIVDTLPRCAERTVALRKLLEAKDAAVRAAL